MDAILFSLIFIGAGIFSLTLGMVEHLRWRALIRHGMKTQGIAGAVTDHDDNVTLLATFEDEQGVSHTVRSKGGDTAWKSLDGRTVDILYEPGEPEKARLATDMKMRQKLTINWFGLLYIGIGITVLVLHLFGIEVIDKG
jgi:hypothetical protein